MPVLITLEVARQSLPSSETFLPSCPGVGVAELGKTWGEQLLLLCPATNVVWSTISLGGVCESVRSTRGTTAGREAGCLGGSLLSGSSWCHLRRPLPRGHSRAVSAFLPHSLLMRCRGGETRRRFVLAGPTIFPTRVCHTAVINHQLCLLCCVCSGLFSSASSTLTSNRTALRGRVWVRVHPCSSGGVSSNGRADSRLRSKIN